MQEFFPNLFEDLLRAGAVPLDTSADIAWYQYGVQKHPAPCGIIMYCQQRPLLEDLIRRALLARPNVQLVENCEAVRLLTNPEQTSVTGVAIRHRGDEPRHEELTADLVIDASGRGSQAPQWLLALGSEAVEETQVKMDVGYACRLYRRSPHARRGLVIIPTLPADKRLGALFPIEDNQWIIQLGAWMHDYPPADEAGFLAFARSLGRPEIYELLQEAEPVGPIATHRLLSNRLRHYERLRHFPDGFLVMGDALCSFNPIYAQGMTVAALEAKALQRWLGHQRHAGQPAAKRSVRLQKKFAHVLTIPWFLATTEDFRFPEIEGKRVPGLRWFHRYSVQIHLLAARDPHVTRRFFEVMHMLKHPLALFSPRIVFAVFLQWMRVKKASPGGPAMSGTR